MVESGGVILSRSARRYTLVLISTVYVFNFVDRQILAILLPAIKAEYAVDDWVLGFLAGPAFALFYVTLGIPISTTHTLVGAVLGVGLARGIEAIDLRVVGRIFVSWVVTIPAGAFLSIVFFFIFKTVLP